MVLPDECSFSIILVKKLGFCGDFFMGCERTYLILFLSCWVGFGARVDFGRWVYTIFVDFVWDLVLEMAVDGVE